MTAHILLVAVIWLLAFASSVLAIALALLAQRRGLRWAAFSAITATLVGSMGFSAWTPFGFFPEIGYTWSSGPFEFSLRSGWLFTAPLVLGAIAFLLTVWKHRTRNDAATGA